MYMQSEINFKEKTYNKAKMSPIKQNKHLQPNSICLILFFTDCLNLSRERLIIGDKNVALLCNILKIKCLLSLEL